MSVWQGLDHYRPTLTYDVWMCHFVPMQGIDEGGLDYALNRAIDAYYNDRAWFRSLQVGSTQGA